MSKLKGSIWWQHNWPSLSLQFHWTYHKDISNLGKLLTHRKVKHYYNSRCSTNELPLLLKFGCTNMLHSLIDYRKNILQEILLEFYLSRIQVWELKVVSRRTLRHKLKFWTHHIILKLYLFSIWEHCSGLCINRCTQPYWNYNLDQQIY
jgi:hypothetical protein